ncbi:hypothetical protein C8R46DRAFT_1028594 [Mycena filopes]|nr:hypothetical protein C8R46DRAFT_1028594 [Mycena filopes]
MAGVPRNGRRPDPGASKWGVKGRQKQDTGAFLDRIACSRNAHSAVNPRRRPTWWSMRRCGTFPPWEGERTPDCRQSVSWGVLNALEMVQEGQRAMMVGGGKARDVTIHASLGVLTRRNANVGHASLGLLTNLRGITKDQNQPKKQTKVKIRAEVLLMLHLALKMLLPCFLELPFHTAVLYDFPDQLPAGAENSALVTEVGGA